MPTIEMPTIEMTENERWRVNACSECSDMAVAAVLSDPPHPDIVTHAKACVTCAATIEAVRLRRCAETCSDSHGRFVYSGLTEEQVQLLVKRAPYFDENRLKNLLLPLTEPQRDAKCSLTSAKLPTTSPSPSLRDMDWVVTNFAKKNRSTFVHNGNRVNLYNEYRSRLRNYTRRNFDPFRRRTRVYFEVNGLWHETTVGQLNFVYFVEEYGVLEYTKQHIDAIKMDMKESLRKNARPRGTKKRLEGGAQGELRESLPVKKARRRELSKNPDVQCFVYTMPVANTVANLAEHDA